MDNAVRVAMVEESMKTMLKFALAGLLVSSLNVPSGLAKKAAEPDVVVVQHILIGIKGKVRGKDVTRSKKDAQVLAEKLYQRALDGEEFDALVEEFTDDKVPGIMRLTNKGAATRADSYERGQLALGFGDTSFRLEVGEIELVKYSYTSSPFGYHIIKRLE